MIVITPKGLKANLTIKSLFIKGEELKPETIDACRNACEIACLQKAVDLWGESQSLTVRDLNASDMSYTNNIFTETSHATTANQWNAMGVGAFTVAQSTVIGIYGLKIQIVQDATIDFPPISGVRIDVGGARVAQWMTQTIDAYCNAAASTPYYAPAGVTKSPVVVGETLTVTIYEYTRTANTVYVPCWLGITVEKEGVTLRP